MTSEQKIAKALSYSESAMIKGIVNRTLIVEWGTIKKVVAKGVVDVLLSVTDRPEKTTVVTCVLISPCSASFAIDIEPQVDDKVLVLSPRHFDPKMFNVTKNTEVIEKPDFTGYNNLSCMAILFNQFKTDAYEASVTINKDNELTVTTPNASTALNKDGELNVTTPNASVDINKDGELNVTTPNATVGIDKNGNVTIEASGKFTFKNNSVDLKDVIDGLAQELENLTTVGSPATQATSPASKGTIATWRSTKLNQLLD